MKKIRNKKKGLTIKGSQRSRLKLRKHTLEGLKTWYMNKERVPVQTSVPFPMNKKMIITVSEMVHIKINEYGK